MTWAEFTAARQLLLEERVGARARSALAAEDAEVERSKKALREADKLVGVVHGSD